MRRMLAHLMLLGLLTITAMPLVWLSNSLFGRQNVFPPLRRDWLECIIHLPFQTEYANACREVALQNGWSSAVWFSSVAFYISLALLFLASLLLWNSSQQSEYQVRGRRLFKGRKAWRQLKHRFKKISGSSSIRLFGVNIPTRVHLRHWLLFGAVGSGKTVFIWSYLNALKVSGKTARSLVLDVKGDFIEALKLPNLDGTLTAPALLNPCDKRSLEWWIGADLTGVPEAREFTKKFLSKSQSEAFWAKATGNVMLAVIRSLQIECGRNWSWAELSDRINAPPDQLLNWANQYYSPAVKILESKDNETATSVLINFATDFAAISDLAAYWDGLTSTDKFSINKWLSFQDRHPNIILGWDASAAEMCAAWAGALVDLIGLKVSSPKFATSPGINLILDEFAQLPKMDGILQAIDVGRSKGVSVLLGAQSFSQLRGIYGPRAESFKSIMGNIVFAQLAPGQDAKDASEFLGDRVIRERQVSTSKSKGGGSSNISWVEKTSPLVMPHEFGSKIGPNKSGISVIYSPIGMDAYLLDVPYPTLEPFRAPFLAKEPSDPYRAKNHGTQRQKTPASNPFKKILDGRC
ncbi:type IV secretion system DNA-binding domain-containing protein [Kordiimonas lacus]|uniref:Type IV secretion-system coupling protein DNA-binding domain-containing protein n=1 Tax=Kordiimonas lacus TaxID=637679 RepID=A0A1G7BJP8_9PROT|nr:type IV secretion system DNA-binding domain-containing protein [Kordiimonas lacus]SDE27152.1 Type IV secretion-system coupling protein DNA-binding domain-containing protein [Kordiimonas lacus]